MAELIFNTIIEAGKKIAKLWSKARSNKKDVKKIEELINLVKAVCSDMTSQEKLVREKIEKDPRMTAAATALRNALLEAEEKVKEYHRSDGTVATAWKKAVGNVFWADSIAEKIRESREEIDKLMRVSTYVICSDTNSTVTETNIKVHQIVDKIDVILFRDRELGRRDMGTTSSSAVVERPRVWSEPDLRAEQQKDVAMVSRDLSLPFVVAALLLRHCNWTPHRVVKAWRQDRDRLLEAVRVSLPSSDVMGPIGLIRGKRECKICFDDGTARKMVSAGCSHYYCEGCWRGYIHAVLATGTQCLSSLRCPDPSCKVAVPRELVQEVADDADVARYDQFVYWSYVNDSGGRMKWCPGPGCSSAAEYLGGDAATASAKAEDLVVVCDDCKHRYCWGCGEEPHRPVSCDMARSWLDIITGRMDLELVFTKRCPKCQRTIDNYQSANIVTCSAPCCHRFCWVCRNPVGVSAINHNAGTGCPFFKPVTEIVLRTWVGKKLPESLQQTNEQVFKVRKDEKRFAMDSDPYKRWEADQASLRQALAELDGLKSSGLCDMADDLGVQVSELNFVIRAYEEITASWRTVRWVHAYEYCRLDPKRDQHKCQQVDYLRKEANDSIQRLQDVVSLANRETLIQVGVEAIFQIHDEVMDLIVGTRRKVYKLMESFDTDDIQN